MSTDASPPSRAALQRLPSVDRLLRLPATAGLLAQHDHAFVSDCARALLAHWRTRLTAPAADDAKGSAPAARDCPADDAAWARALADRCDARFASRLRAMLNLTGTVLHTNMGRALLADEALAQVLRLMSAPNNLEYDLQTGARGDRDDLIEELLCEITGAEAATVVNNNAAAVLLTLAAMARGREVIISRGELVEIGGAFRMPDVMASAGAHMVEVGTTNRTHPADYERAINERTALILKVHTSNYAVQGFTSAVAERELAAIARARGVPLASDLGSGALVDLSRWGLPREPLPQDALADGCDIVTFSGDKLLGGPQAGLIVGSREAVGRIRRFPMKRALRVSKLPLAALEATLRLYLRPDRVARDIPTLRLLTRPVAQMRALAAELEAPLREALEPRFRVDVVELMSQIGSGSLPVDRLPSAGLAIAPVAVKGAGRALDDLSSALRALPMPVIGRISEDRLLLDLRCLESAAPLREQLPALRDALNA